jgi:hypothetical protein
MLYPACCSICLGKRIVLLTAKKREKLTSANLFKSSEDVPRRPNFLYQNSSSSDGISISNGINELEEVGLEGAVKQL